MLLLWSASLISPVGMGVKHTKVLSAPARGIRHRWNTGLLYPPEFSSAITPNAQAAADGPGRYHFGPGFFCVRHQGKGPSHVESRGASRCSVATGGSSSPFRQAWFPKCGAARGMPAWQAPNRSIRSGLLRQEQDCYEPGGRKFESLGAEALARRRLAGRTNFTW